MSKETTNSLVEMTRQITTYLQEGSLTMKHFHDMKVFMENHFDKLDLSPLMHSLRDTGRKHVFNAYMALMNKHLGMSKELIPFELELRDYVLADKIIKKIKS